MRKLLFINLQDSTKVNKLSVITGAQTGKVKVFYLSDLEQEINLLYKSTITAVIKPTIKKFILFERFSVLIPKIDAIAVMTNKKNGKDSRVCKF